MIFGTIIIATQKTNFMLQTITAMSTPAGYDNVVATAYSDNAAGAATTDSVTGAMPTAPLPFSSPYRLLVSPLPPLLFRKMLAPMTQLLSQKKIQGLS